MKLALSNDALDKTSSDWNTKLEQDLISTALLTVISVSNLYLSYRYTNISIYRYRSPSQR